MSPGFLSALHPVLVAIALLVLPLSLRADDGPRLRDVLARAGDFVVALGEGLSTVVAEERYVQTYRTDSGAVPTRRELRSEFVLVRVADRDEWVGFRDVFRVDDQRVRDRRDRLERLFLETPDTALARARVIADESARYNLGPVRRNFNVPTAALFFLHPANSSRFRFKKIAERSLSGSTLWEVSYEETQRPTLVRTPAGANIPARGRFWIDPASGTIVRTEFLLQLEERKLDVRISVTYEHDGGLDLWVPAEMRETYNGEGGEHITGVATYHNFRRFRVTARIRPPGL